MSARRSITAVAAAISITISLLSWGCWRERHEVIPKESLSWVVFTGNISGAEFSLEGDSGVVWNSTAVVKNRKYAAKPGRYLITVGKRGNSVLRRTILLADGQTVPIGVP